MTSERIHVRRQEPVWPPSAVMTIDLDAIAANYRTLRDLMHPALCAAVVKADAYGLGVADIAPVLERCGCRWFFVAQLEEAVDLRAILGSGPIIAVLNGLVPGTEQICRDFNLTPVLNGLDQVRAWAATARDASTRRRGILQFDTGMSRFGFDRGEWDAVLAAPDVFEWVEPILLMTHLACADTPDHPANAAQRDRFETMAALLPGVPRSLAASSAMFMGPDYRLDLGRPGSALYGINPQPGLPNPMRPVVRLQARVVQVRHVPADTTVGYGCVGRVERASRLATIAVGYADGLLRSSSGRAGVWIGDRHLPMIGRVSMDSIVVDASDLDAGQLALGDLVDLVGPHCDVDRLARAAGTIGYEILTSLGHRYARIYLPFKERSR